MRVRAGVRRTNTQILNHSRRGTSLSASRRSALLSSVRNQDSGLSGASRMAMMMSARLTKSSYEKLERSATSLVEQTRLLADKADAGGKDVTSTAAEMVQNFNDTYDGLKNSSGILNSYYRNSMKEIALTNKDSLAEIGITVRTDGSLYLDKDKLAGADEEKIKKALGSASDFAKRIDAVASRAADNAKAGAASASSQYNSSGNLANSYLSRYNFWS